MCPIKALRPLSVALKSCSNSFLRPYQQECIDKCIQSITHGTKRIGVSIATGGGKTVIFSHLIDRLRSLSGRDTFRTLILVHRRELAQQASNVLATFFPQYDVQIEMGKLKCEIDTADVIVASVQTLVRRLDRFDPKTIDLIIIDEAHHAAAKSYLQILKHFNADHSSTLIPVVGFSATFERADNKALSAVMDDIVFHRGIIEMIDNKWLCESRFTTVDVKLNLSAVSISGSDFQIDGLSQVVNTREVNNVVLETYLRKKQQYNLRSTLLFGCDVEHVQTLQALFQKSDINAQFVTAKTRQSERDSIVEDFKNGKVEVLMNCGIFTEGTDLPSIDSILLCRPTRSRSLLVQMIGRGLRLHRSKDRCHIFDFVDAANVGVVSFPTLVGIEDVDLDLTDATIQELQVIKEELVLKQQEADMEKGRDRENERLAHQKFRDLLKNSQAFDLTLTTFEDFLSFHKQTAAMTDPEDPIWDSDLGKEIKLIRESSYPWVRFAKNAWAMSIDSHHHLRIYKECNKASKKLGATYVLKLYTLFPDRVRADAGARYKTHEVKTDKNLAVVVAAVEKLVKEFLTQPGSKVKNFTKYSPWRLTAASTKQKSLLQSKITKLISKEDSKFSEKLDASIVKKYVDNLTKGEASNILFATSVAPVYPLKSLCKVLNYRS
ncbi:LANO_0B05380g1_1 [Lachancea nothofagi CBS 11611]|uniref:LANO_0B05380g1_1 n=1 Tax=Lachancea nothofagi CBS 11611 TaxID=1266666 RepID=A0A1G4IYC9_9SACH|nr:LANO_0B05380g1_1 [Lachancea nothofagi CBS 11611]